MLLELMVVRFFLGVNSINKKKKLNNNNCKLMLKIPNDLSKYPSLPSTDIMKF